MGNSRHYLHSSTLMGNFSSQGEESYAFDEVPENTFFILISEKGPLNRILPLELVVVDAFKDHHDVHLVPRGCHGSQN